MSATAWEICCELLLRQPDALSEADLRVHLSQFVRAVFAEDLAQHHRLRPLLEAAQVDHADRRRLEAAVQSLIGREVKELESLLATKECVPVG